MRLKDMIDQSIEKISALSKVPRISNAMRLKEVIDQSIERISAFYREQGIEVGEPPTYKILSTHSLASKLAIMHVPGAIQRSRELEQQFIQEHMVPIKQEVYARKGIRLSNDALRESLTVEASRIAKLTGASSTGSDVLHNHGAEIIIYKTAQDILDRNQEHAQEIFDDFMAHELWHVVELRRGLLATMICEGTADFARGTYRGARNPHEVTLPRYRESAANAALWQINGNMMYTLGLRAVQEHATTLTHLLEPDRRGRMEQDMTRLLHEHMRKEMESPSINSEQSGALLRAVFPEYNVLNTDFSREGLQRAYELAGMPTMAREIATQDCSELLQEFAARGFGPESAPWILPPGS